ncbi:hypothetical protein [Mesoaciditoga lauensis]|uniref:hypothetical protein n=1 Tax=Mesoaciditoga lauensis TaxID=1495039 RepID=UPI0012E04D0F|nr:hypothetical protein [Mesoaciditoga lauensis]
MLVNLATKATRFKSETGGTTIFWSVKSIAERTNYTMIIIERTKVLLPYSISFRFMISRMKLEERATFTTRD